MTISAGILVFKSAKTEVRGDKRAKNRKRNKRDFLI
jgi:hypothetical protein